MNATNRTAAADDNCAVFIQVNTAISPQITFSALATSYTGVGTGFMAIFGNAVFLYIMYSVRRLRTTFNVVLILLAITDLCVGLLCVPIYITLGIMKAIKVQSCVLELANFFISAFANGLSLWTISLMSVDRLLAVIFPLRRKGWSLDKIYVALFTGMSIFVILLFILAEMARLNNEVRLILSSMVFLVLASILICYVLIFLAIKRREKNLGNMTSVQLQKKKRKAITSGYITLLVVVLYLPRLFAFLQKDEEANWHFKRWTGLLIYMNSAIDPAIYIYRREHMMEEFQTLVCRFRRRISRMVVRNRASPDCNTSAASV